MRTVDVIDTSMEGTSLLEIKECDGSTVISVAIPTDLAYETGNALVCSIEEYKWKGLPK